MALQSVTTQPVKPSAKHGRTHDLWIGGSLVLTVSIDSGRNGFPAQVEQITALNYMIQDLARAAKAVAYHAEKTTTSSFEHAMGPIDGIADTILLLTQLSGAVHHELAGSDAEKEA